MLFPKLTLEPVLQVEDRVRLNADLSFATNDETITDILIRPEATEDFISVFEEDYPEKWYLDWAYSVEGAKEVEVKMVTATTERTRVHDITVLTEEEDALFSKDSELFAYEPSLYKRLPIGKSSFIYAHRASQNKILAYLDEQRIWKQDGTRFGKYDILDKEEFNRWSMFQTLLIIFESSQVTSDDIFQEKRKEYENEMRQARNRSSLRLDVDGNGETDDLPYNIRSARMIRR